MFKPPVSPDSSIPTVLYEAIVAHNYYWRNGLRAYHTLSNHRFRYRTCITTCSRTVLALGCAEQYALSTLTKYEMYVM
jgi:hypothetical protein